MHRTLWSALPVVIGLSACSEFNIRRTVDGPGASRASIEVDPPSLVFGELRSDEEEVQTFTVRNVGTQMLEISDVVVGTGIAFEVVGPETEFDLLPGEEQTVDVRFSPMEANENFGQVLVLSDDRVSPETPVDLLGMGHVPELRITPSEHTFADAVVPCGETVAVTFENIGQEDLILTDVSYASAYGSMTFDDGGLAATLPIVLEPGQTIGGMSVTFAPGSEVPETGTITTESSDPRRTVTATQAGEGAYLEENAELFTEPGVPPVDVLMLIDQSCSMEDENIAAVRQGMGPFVEELAQVSDWQLLQVTQPNGCGNEGILDPSTPDVDQILIDNAFNNSGSTLPYSEKLLEHAALVLEKTAPGGCNEGFLRAGSLLHIIAISDEPEQSNVPYTDWLDTYESYVLGPEYLRVSAVVDLSLCQLGGGGYLEAASATGGTILDICTAQWGSDFVDIAAEILDGVRTYNFEQPAAADSVVVKVNGVVTTDITVVGSSSVTVNSPPIGEDDVVEITYAVLAECD